MIDALINKQPRHYDVVIVGGGQAGLSASFYLQKQNINHLVIEKHTVMHSWSEQRWDSFSLVTPNWQCDLPGHPYDGDDPNGFMVRDEIVAYLERFAKKVNAPVIENTTVKNINPIDSGRYAKGNYYIETNNGTFTADQIIVAAGGYHSPIIPPMAERIPDSVTQIHSAQYKNPKDLPEGAVMVVGSGQSGAQIAEDLHLEGRKVYLATGDAPRCARFYRGRDVVDWLADMKYYEMPVTEHPLREGVRDNTNHYVTGRDGGRDIDLRQFAKEGMELFGLLEDFDGVNFKFTPNLIENLDRADKVYNNINQRIDNYIKENYIDAPEASVYEPVWQPDGERETLSLAQTDISTVLWAIGFRSEFNWLNFDIFNSHGYPIHERGMTEQPGLYFIGLPWLHTWGSGRFSGVAGDAKFICDQVIDYIETCCTTERKSA